MYLPERYQKVSFISTIYGFGRYKKYPAFSIHVKINDTEIITCIYRHDTESIVHFDMCRLAQYKKVSRISIHVEINDTESVTCIYRDDTESIVHFDMCRFELYTKYMCFDKCRISRQILQVPCENDDYHCGRHSTKNPD